MGRIRENKIRRDQVVSAIRVLLENQGIDSGSDWDMDSDNLKKLNALADGSAGWTVYSGDLGITQEEDETKLIFCVDSGEPDFFRQQLPQEAARALAEAGTKTIQLVFFVRDMQSRISLETRLDAADLRNLRKAIQNKATGSVPSVKKTYKLLTNYVLLQEYMAQDVRLTNLRPLEMLHEPPVDRSITVETQPADAGDIQARVFTVDLYQLVQKYNLIGDTLFQNNVRFGINEALGVEQSMRETLASEPEHFWFKNNGVTFLIQNSHTFLQESKTVLLGRLDPNKLLPFSVINGAQTITTAARYFFGLEAKADKNADDKRILEAAKREAHVLVRVINVINKDSTRADQDSRAISVALNRQKPIRMDDIAFTHPAVLKLAEYLRKQGDGAPFTLVRQGETATNIGSIDLISFARARMACAGQPGAARTKGRDKLLELKTNEDGSIRFRQAELFSPDWLNAEDEKTETAIFRRDYHAIRFAYQLAKAYEAEMRKFESADTELLNTVRNGKWYFVAIMTQIMNGFRPDYSDFSAGTISNLPQLIEQLARVMISLAHAADDGKEINSNLFKTEKLYHNVIGRLKENLSAHSLRIPISDDQIFQLISAESPSSSTYGYDVIDIPASYVVLDRRRMDVSTDAQALVLIAKYVLEAYPEAEADLLYRCSSWLASLDSDSSKTNGVFWINGKRFYVDANANWEDKRRRMSKLCAIAGVSPDTIYWHKSGDNAFTFSW